MYPLSSILSHSESFYLEGKCANGGLLKLPTLGYESYVEAIAEFDSIEGTTNKHATNVPVNVRVNDPIYENDPINGTLNDHFNKNGTLIITKYQVDSYKYQYKHNSVDNRRF